ncbi:protein-disulfide isomerase [Sphingomonas prati]|uniref:Protein-disulfide isomerase n=2 Tax=Sphingomonas prati TaxID=1843237 RepID=A0A7W9BSD3_9SPHN|nr:protein-disulfide isomerase [Sphingomonas prati]
MTRTLLALGLSTLALTACGSKDAGNSAGSATASVEAPASPVAPVAAPAGGDWTQTVSKTADGGFRMGNPDAPVKLVEYGALSCSHCAVFEKEGLPELKSQFIAPGKVSYEFRNYMLNVLDVPAALLTRCRGAEPYFQLSQQMFENQMMLFDAVKGMTEAEQTQMQAMPPQTQFLAWGKKLGLIDFFRARGIPEAAATKCLTDTAAVDELGKMSARATSEYNLQGTPTFLIANKPVPNVADWAALKPVLAKAVGA